MDSKNVSKKSLKFNTAASWASEIFEYFLSVFEYFHTIFVRPALSLSKGSILFSNVFEYFRTFSPKPAPLPPLEPLYEKFRAYFSLPKLPILSILPKMIILISL
jgi:hypothetical protein